MHSGGIGNYMNGVANTISQFTISSWRDRKSAKRLCVDGTYITEKLNLANNSDHR